MTDEPAKRIIFDSAEIGKLPSFEKRARCLGSPPTTSFPREPLHIPPLRRALSLERGKVVGPWFLLAGCRVRLQYVARFAPTRSRTDDPFLLHRLYQSRRP